MARTITSVTPEFTPASFDEKNLLTDWIEEIFDEQACVWSGNRRCVGFVRNSPQFLSVLGNKLSFTGGSACDTITQRIQAILEGIEDIAIRINITDASILEVYFYFTDIS